MFINLQLKKWFFADGTLEKMADKRIGATAKVREIDRIEVALFFDNSGAPHDPLAITPVHGFEVLVGFNGPNRFAYLDNLWLIPKPMPATVQTFESIAAGTTYPGGPGTATVAAIPAALQAAPANGTQVQNSSTQAFSIIGRRYQPRWKAMVRSEALLVPLDGVNSVHSLAIVLVSAMRTRA